MLTLYAKAKRDSIPAHILKQCLVTGRWLSLSLSAMCGRGPGSGTGDQGWRWQAYEGLGQYRSRGRRTVRIGGEAR
jgi:hypothetical protein